MPISFNDMLSAVVFCLCCQALSILLTTTILSFINVTQQGYFVTLILTLIIL